MAIRRTQEFLDGNHIRYALIGHSPAYTASEVAQSVHVPGRNLAKVVIVSVDGQLAMAVVPATRDVNLVLLQQVTGKADVRLAYESEFADRFEGSQLGAAPPFGNLYGVETYVEPSLVLDEYLAFNAGTHRDVVVMGSEDYVRMAQPRLVHIDAEPIHERFQTISI